MLRYPEYVLAVVLLCFLGLLQLSTAVTFQEMYTDCHDDYACLMYPEPCHKAKNCDLIVIIKKLGSKYNFRLLGKGPYYVAVGMSTDRAMGHDAVVFCTAELVGTAINPRGHNMTRILNWDPDIENVDMRVENGRVICQFDAPTNFVVGPLQMNLETPFYLLMATGTRHYPPVALVPFAPHTIKLVSRKAVVSTSSVKFQDGQGGNGYRDTENGYDNDQHKSSKENDSSAFRHTDVVLWISTFWLLFNNISMQSHLVCAY